MAFTDMRRVRFGDSITDYLMLTISLRFFAPYEDGLPTVRPLVYNENYLLGD